MTIRTLSLTAVGMSLAACVSAPTVTSVDAPAADPPACPGYHAGLVTRQARMNALLQRQIEEHWTKDDPGIAQIEAHSRDDVRWLAEQAQRCGWPTDPSAEEPAGLIAVHGAGDPAAQEQLLGLIEAAIAREPRNAQTYALLFDKLAIGKGKPQRFGTQAIVGDGTACFLPIEDPAHLDARRAQYGLEPWNDYAKDLADLYGVTFGACSEHASDTQQ